MSTTAVMGQTRVDTRRPGANRLKMKNIAWVVGCALPYASFGRLSVPTRQLRYQDGYIRFTESKDGQRLLCFLVDEHDQLIYEESQIEACLKSERLGIAVQYYLKEYNNYEAGELVGDRSTVMVAT